MNIEAWILIIAEAGDPHQTEGCRSSEYLLGRPGQ